MSRNDLGENPSQKNLFKKKSLAAPHLETLPSPQTDVAARVTDSSVYLLLLIQCWAAQPNLRFLPPPSWCHPDFWVISVFLGNSRFPRPLVAECLAGRQRKKRCQNVGHPRQLEKVLESYCGFSTHIRPDTPRSCSYEYFHSAQRVAMNPKRQQGRISPIPLIKVTQLLAKSSSLRS